MAMSSPPSEELLSFEPRSSPAARLDPGMIRDKRRSVGAKPTQDPTTALLPLPPPGVSRSWADPSDSVGTSLGVASASSVRSARSVCSANAATGASRCCGCSCLDGVIGSLSALIGSTSAGSQKAKDKEPDAPRRWYRVHPITDELYFVRPDAGLAGRTAGHPDAGQLHRPSGEHQEASVGSSPVESQLKRVQRTRNSLPHHMDRMQGLDDPGFNDVFVNLCKLCFDRTADVVLLPCKHGGMCETCLRKSLFIRPAHRGGMGCPWCRRKIMEVIKMYKDGTINMYGYAISAGCFFEGKDDN